MFNAADLSPIAPPLAVIQGAYFTISGIWPLVSIGSFQAVTSPKTDLWLVKTVAVLVVVVGGALVLGGLQRELGLGMVWLATGSAAALTAIEVIYVARGTIPRVYLLDAIAEILLLVLWLVALLF